MSSVQKLSGDNESLVSAGSSTSNNEDHSKILKHEYDEEKHLKEETNMFAHIFGKYIAHHIVTIRIRLICN